MILNYQKKFFFSKKCQNFNDFKLSKKDFFQKNVKILMILNYQKKFFFQKMSKF